MRTSGELLKNKRSKLGLSLEAISKKLKIHQKYLLSLENGDYKVFDSRVIARGFLVKYSEFLKLDTEKVLAYWRRDFAVNTNIEFPKENIFSKFIVTPRVISIISVFLIILVLFLFGYYQYTLVKQPPYLVINEPVNEYSTFENLVILKGSISTDSEVFLNGRQITINEEGAFTENLYLSPGVNKFIVKAVNTLGIENSKSITVYNTAKQNDIFIENSTGKNILAIKTTGSKPTFVEINDGEKSLFTGFVLPNVQKEFKGNDFALYTDTIENLIIYYNGNEINKGEKEFGIFDSKINDLISE